MDLLSGYKQSGAQDNWGLLYHHFVEGGHAGFITVNCRTKAIEHINPKLFQLHAPVWIAYLNNFE